MDNNTLTNKNLLAILEENLKKINPQQTEVLIHEIKAAKRIFVMAAGRSGLALKWQLCDLCTWVYYS
jgi:6-phospho-3-hexuloisomerase